MLLLRAALSSRSDGASLADLVPLVITVLTSTWWETISRLASLRTNEVRLAGEVWDDDIAQGLIAALMATIQVCQLSQPVTDD